MGFIMVATVRQLFQLHHDGNHAANISDMFQAAAQRCMEFMCARFSDPVYFGDYPQVIKDTVPSLLKFTSEEQSALKGSVDFFLINHYSTKYISHKKDSAGETGMNLFDGTCSVQHTERDGKQIGPQVNLMCISTAYCKACLTGMSGSPARCEKLAACIAVCSC